MSLRLPFYQHLLVHSPGPLVAFFFNAHRCRRVLAALTACRNPAWDREGLYQWAYNAQDWAGVGRLHVRSCWPSAPVLARAALRVSIEYGGTGHQATGPRCLPAVQVGCAAQRVGDGAADALCAAHAARGGGAAAAWGRSR